jgi:hypothetical protein
MSEKIERFFFVVQGNVVRSPYRRRFHQFFTRELMYTGTFRSTGTAGSTEQPLHLPLVTNQKNVIMSDWCPE